MAVPGSGVHDFNWTSDDGLGRTACVGLGEGVVLVTLAGRVPREAAVPLVPAMERAFASAKSVHSFWDLSSLEHYHSEVRVQCTGILVKYRANLLSVQTYTRSRIVAMGVSVANLALGGLVKQHASQASFDAALARLTRAA